MGSLTWGNIDLGEYRYRGTYSPLGRLIADKNSVTEVSSIRWYSGTVCTLLVTVLWVKTDVFLPSFTCALTAGVVGTPQMNSQPVSSTFRCSCRVIKHLYEQVTSAVLFNGSIGDWFRTTVGVRQGCLLSFTLFNIFLERTMTDALEDHEGTVSVGGKTITNLRFADDIDG